MLYINKEMQNHKVTLESSLVDSCEDKHVLTMWLSYCTPITREMKMDLYGEWEFLCQI